MNLQSKDIFACEAFQGQVNFVLTPVRGKNVHMIFSTKKVVRVSDLEMVEKTLNLASELLSCNYEKSHKNYNDFTVVFSASPPSGNLQFW